MPWGPLGILTCLGRCHVLSRVGVGGLDSLDLSWSRGCEGVVAASQYWFFTIVDF